MGSKDFWIGTKMSDWKLRQDLYHRLNREHPDEYGPDDIQMMDDTSDSAIIEMVVRYLNGYIPEKVIYPAKSYFVAIVYARLLRDNFMEDAYDVLDDPMLLFGNDPYFRTYGEAKAIYDSVLDQTSWDFDLTLGEIPDVKSYFDEEFMLDQDA